jgi:signal transduction histidine kinase
MDRLSRPRLPLLRRGAVQDALLAVVLTAMSIVSLWSPEPALITDAFTDPDALGVLLAVVACAPVAARRRLPEVATALSLAGTLIAVGLGYNQSISGLASLLTLYTVAARRPERVSLPVGLGAVAGMAWVFVAGPFEATLSDWLANLLAVAVVWVVGRTVRVRRLHLADLGERNRAIRDAEEAETRTILAEERAATAREMQDLVAHHLTEVNVQIAAARRLLVTDSESAQHFLLEAERVSRSAMNEIRRAGGLLARDAGAADRRPQPTLADVGNLVAARRAAGVEVSYAAEPCPEQVAPGVGLTAYRVVEEALGNAARHAPDLPVRVAVGCEGAWLSVEVLSAPGAEGFRGTEEEPVPGSTLQRLRTRVAAYGGELRWGQRRDRSFLVVARLPLQEGATRP